MPLGLRRQVYAIYHWTRICQQITNIFFSNFFVMHPTSKNPIKDVLIERIRLGTNPSKFNLFSTKAYTLTRFPCVPKFSKVCLQISICFGLNEKKVAIKRTMRRSTQPDLASIVIQALLYSVYD